MIAVIIPSKTVENLVPCMEAVRKHEPEAKMVVIDDGLSMDWLPRIDFMPAACLRGEKPFVFARNVNIGIKEASAAEGYVILNDDAILQTPGGFSLLAQDAKDHPEYGIIAATTNSVGNPNQMPHGLGLREDPRMVCFVAVYIPRTTIEKVGLLDETIGRGGFEDDDYCLRVRNAGLKIGIHDGAFVDHTSLKSTFRGPGGTGYDPQAADNFKRKWGHDNWGNK